MIQRVERQFFCKIARAKATIARETLEVSGIGSAVNWIQKEYSCSKNDGCAFSENKRCPVQILMGRHGR